MLSAQMCMRSVHAVCANVYEECACCVRKCVSGVCMLCAQVCVRSVHAVCASVCEECAFCVCKCV